jgi:outer membrane lipoprotein-sorting protein
MSSLGAVLELIHSSARRFHTARAVGRSADSTWRFWWAGDDRFRFERKRQAGGFVNVRAGAVWWVLDSEGQASTNRGDSNYGLGMQPELGMLHPRSLLATAILEVLRNEQVAGRPAAIMRATPRSGADHWRWWGSWGASEPVEIAIDLERGVALDSLHYKVDEIAFDEEFAPEVFDRPYDNAHPVEEIERPPREMSLEQSQRTAPFRLAIPRVLPDGARLVRCLVDPAEPPEWVGLSWAIDPGHSYTLHLRQGPAVAREAERFRREEITEQGMRLVAEEAEPERRLRRLFARAHGGWCEIDSDLPIETLVAIAVSLEGTS